MTKFEEEFKALTSWDWVNVDLIQQILTRFGNWHSDEEFQAEKDARKKEYEIHQDIYSKTSKKLNKAELEIANLKSQLQQQALPVVPDFIGKLINTFGAPEDGKYINYSASYLENQKELDWIDNHQKTWLTALLIGFRVEKPQLFKLIFPNSTAVLQKDGELNSFADTVYKRYLIGNAMTEQEIKSIDERYWQFAVPVEDGE